MQIMQILLLNLNTIVGEQNVTRCLLVLSLDVTDHIRFGVFIHRQSKVKGWYWIFKIRKERQLFPHSSLLMLSTRSCFSLCIVLHLTGRWYIIYNPITTVGCSARPRLEIQSCSQNISFFHFQQVR
jgi:hypothetical protein